MQVLTSFGTLGVGGIHSLAIYFFCSYFALIKDSRGLKIIAKEESEQKRKKMNIGHSRS